jgi:transposase
MVYAILAYMYISTVPNRNSPPAILLRESFRENGKVKNRTLANISKWDPLRIEAFKKVLKGEFDGVDALPEIGKNFGLLYALKSLSDECGITKALGKTNKGLLSLFLVLARIAHQGSRLSSVRWAKEQSVEEVLGLKVFDEDDLYASLDWLEQHQETIEQKLYNNYLKTHGRPPIMVLYDVTSSYFEGMKNELAEFGYNRDKKKGKKQIVIGLLADENGEPLAVRVFKGNTTDTTTMATQIDLVKEKFGITEVVFIGDKGMIKSTGKKALTESGLKYITSLNKAEITTLIKTKNVQLDMFEEEVSEVIIEDKRYILRRNDAIRRKLRHDRNNRIEKIKKLIAERNKYIVEHPRAKVATGQKNIEAIIHAWRLSGYVALSLSKDEIEINIDMETHDELFALDGCYMLETDVKENIMGKELVDENYHRLAKVEKNFRTMKTGGLEIRPIFLRNAERTIGHVFVASLALRITNLFASKLKAKFGVDRNGHYNVTLKEALEQLGKINLLCYSVKGAKCEKLPKLTARQQDILEAIGAALPSI